MVAAMAVEELNSVLWLERDLLDDLAFALETEQWVHATGRTRWLRRAADQVRAAGDRLREAEVLRAAESDALAVEFGLAPAPSLTELAECAGEPWRTILLEQRSVLLSATAEVTAGHPGPRPAPEVDAPARAARPGSGRLRRSPVHRDG